MPALPIQSVAGCDEAGRGPLAGPVVAAAVVLTPAFLKTWPLHYLRDSKKMSPLLRERVAHKLLILAHGQNPCLHYALAYISAATIDKINIRKASLMAMDQAVRSLPMQPHLVMVDGRDALPNHTSLAITRGDGCHAAIAAASILAKVARDAWMDTLAERYPDYGFERHKGYGTKTHLDAIKRFGPCPEHRISFAPLSNNLP